MPVLVMNGTTEVEVARALPGQRVQVAYLDFYNADTAAVTVLVKVYDQLGTARTVRKSAIQPDASSTPYDSQNGPQLSGGERMIVVLNAAVVTNQPICHVNTR